MRSRKKTPQIDTDLTTPTHSPKLASVLLAETPVRGAMGFRLLVDKRKSAALNLFSDTPNLFDAESAGRAAVLASFASVAINAVAKGEDAASLRRGLLSNREIGKAVGMLMLLHDMTEEQAFDLLRRHSQGLNIKRLTWRGRSSKSAVRCRPTARICFRRTQGLIGHELPLYQRKCPSGLGGVFDEGSANAVAEPDGFLTGLHPFGHIDHGVALVLDVVR